VFELSATIDQLRTTQVTAVGLADRIDATSRKMNELQQRLETFSLSVCARYWIMNAVCSTGLTSVA